MATSVRNALVTESSAFRHVRFAPDSAGSSSFIRRMLSSIIRISSFIAAASPSPRASTPVSSGPVNRAVVSIFLLEDDLTMDRTFSTLESVHAVLLTVFLHVSIVRPGKPQVQYLQ